MLVEPIGIIRSPFKEAKGTPIQPRFAKGVKGTVEIYDRFVPALAGVEGFERIWLLYWFDRASEPKHMVKPYLSETPRGLFATRAPCRFNPIGLSSVRLLAVKGNLLEIEELDALDGTPLLDVKPYTPRFDCFDVDRSGWLDDASRRDGIADERFEGRNRGHR
jgi:tRNA-Thr(GGU) m(6)t(6)A37 methyltransferase TsaA